MGTMLRRANDVEAKAKKFRVRLVAKRPESDWRLQNFLYTGSG